MTDLGIIALMVLCMIAWTLLMSAVWGWVLAGRTPTMEGPQ